MRPPARRVGKAALSTDAAPRDRGRGSTFLAKRECREPLGGWGRRRSGSVPPNLDRVINEQNAHHREPTSHPSNPAAPGREVVVNATSTGSHRHRQALFEAPPTMVLLTPISASCGSKTRRVDYSSP